MEGFEKQQLEYGIHENKCNIILRRIKDDVFKGTNFWQCLEWTHLILNMCKLTLNFCEQKLHFALICIAATSILNWDFFFHYPSVRYLLLLISGVDSLINMSQIT